MIENLFPPHSLIPSLELLKMRLLVETDIDVVAAIGLALVAYIEQFPLHPGILARL